MKLFKLFIFIASSIVIGSLAGCTDEAISPFDPSGSGGYEEVKGDALKFTVKLDRVFDEKDGTRALDYEWDNTTYAYYENYIDVQDMFHVYFFDLTGKFLFESKSRWVNQLSSGTTTEWEVTSPVFTMGNADDYGDYWAYIKDKLRNEGFKIAILANHTESQVPQDWGPEKTKYSEAYDAVRKGLQPIAEDLKDKTLPELEKSLVTINDFHFTNSSGAYNSKGTDAQKKRYEAYKAVVKDGSLTGPSNIWMVSRSEMNDGLNPFPKSFDSRATAKEWIREFWDPSRRLNPKDAVYMNETQYRFYRHLHYLWNFGGDDRFTIKTDASGNIVRDKYEDPEFEETVKNASSNPISYSYHAKEWEGRNGYVLRNWLTDWKAGTPKTSASYGSDFSIHSDDYGEFYNIDFTPGGYSEAVVPDESQKYYGVKLKAISEPTDFDTSVKDCIHFTARSVGSIFLKVSGGSGTNKLQIKINGNMNDSKSYTVAANKTTDISHESLAHCAGGDADVWIYCTSGEVTIHQIEFVRDQYLYLTDREGILPSMENPIPMYGVQDFPPLGDVWDEGSTYNLSQILEGSISDIYQSRSISLIRSVAKVTVWFPKTLGEPKHIYARGFNTTAFAEPMDVFMPTNLLWSKDVSHPQSVNYDKSFDANYYDKYFGFYRNFYKFSSDAEKKEKQAEITGLTHNGVCEWYKLQEFGPYFGSNLAFDTYYGWLYGSWAKLPFPWHYNNLEAYQNLSPVNGFDSPHIFNPLILRADFISFVDVTKYFNDNYYHYVIYMPERAIDDPTTLADKASGTTIIPHIEIRFKSGSTQVTATDDRNLEDNDCYRIYFTQNGMTDYGRSLKKDDFNAYEQNNSNLKKHWPVVRNHLYRFIVTDVNQTDLNFLIVDAEQRFPEEIVYE
ncbi:MAG: hypothetical protein J1D77_01170 [Muribaculaceae bacterium]|nr:hypothetical protein [Muribaculaceae bacterium]